MATAKLLSHQWNTAHASNMTLPKVSVTLNSCATRVRHQSMCRRAIISRKWSELQKNKRKDCPKIRPKKDHVRNIQERTVLNEPACQEYYQSSKYRRAGKQSRARKQKHSKEH